MFYYFASGSRLGSARPSTAPGLDHPLRSVNPSETALREAVASRSLLLPSIPSRSHFFKLCHKAQGGAAKDVEEEDTMPPADLIPSLSIYRPSSPVSNLPRECVSLSPNFSKFVHLWIEEPAPCNSSIDAYSFVAVLLQSI